MDTANTSLSKRQFALDVQWAATSLIPYFMERSRGDYYRIERAKAIRWHRGSNVILNPKLHIAIAILIDCKSVTLKGGAEPIEVVQTLLRIKRIKNRDMENLFSDLVKCAS